MINFKKVSKQIWKEIKKADNILIHLHPSPDGDSAGAALAFMHVLNNMNKKVTVISGDSELPKFLLALPGSDKIVPKNYLNVDLTQYDLFLILDASSLTQISKMGKVIFPESLKTIVIDHHATNENFADINLVLENAPATCQILYNFFEVNKIKINKETAVCLFVGIYTDSGAFKYSNANWQTLEIVSKLAKINPEYNKIIFELENNDEPDRLKLLSILLGSIETYFSDHIAIASVDYETIKKNNISHTVLSSSEVANKLKSVIGWDIGISLIEVQPNTVKLSFRTRDSEKYDLGKIAAATGFGGGHKAAAGATINKPFKEAKQVLLDTIKKLYPKLGKI